MKQACISAFLRDYLIKRKDLRLTIIERQLKLPKGCLGKVRKGTIRVPKRRQEAVFSYFAKHGLRFDAFLFFTMHGLFHLIDFSEGDEFSSFSEYGTLSRFISDYYEAEEW